MKEKISLILLALFLFPSTVLAAPAPYTDVGYIEHFEAIYKTKEWGLFEGYSDGTFKPTQEMNRAELSKVLVLGSGVEESEVGTCADGATQTFTDVPSDEWYTDYVYCAQAKGWVSGDDGKDTFRPGDPILMGEAFKLPVESQYETPDASYEGTAWYDQYINFLEDYKLIEVLTNVYSGVAYTSYVYPYLGVAYNDREIGFNSSSLASKMQRMDIAELLYRLRTVFEENNGEDFELFLTLDEMSEKYGTEFDTENNTLSIRDPYFGFSAENIPFPGVSTPATEDDLRVFVLNPSGFQNGDATIWYLLYPDPDPDHSLKSSEGYVSYFNVQIKSPDSSKNFSYDFENEEGAEYAFFCY